MEKIASFTVNHLDLLPGVYVSRKDHVGQETLTTFDLRMCAPNREPVMNTAEMHTIEHLGATYLRNCEYKSDVVYFGPMGCRTGFYLLMFNELESEDIYELVNSMCKYILNFEGEIPGARKEECGNYSEQNLDMAKYYVKKYLDELNEYKRFVYPE